MVLPIPSHAIEQAQKTHGAQAWIHAVRVVIDVSSVATTVAYLTDRQEVLSWSGLTFYPFPMLVGDTQQDSEGSLPHVEISLSNVTRLWSPYVDQGAGFIGQQVSLYRFSTANLATPWLAEFYEIRTVSVSRQAVTFRLEIPNPTGYQVPADQFLRNSCRHIYGGARCGFRLTSGLPGHLESCDKTLPACQERGDYEVSIGQARLHPRRFGGFPTMPRSIRQ